MTSIDLVRAERWLSDYQARFEAVQMAQTKVEGLSAIGNVSAQRPYGDMGVEARSAYDQARLAHLARLAELDAFVSDTPKLLMQTAGQMDAVMRDQSRPLWERDQARIAQEAAIENYGIFLNLRNENRWAPSGGLNYQIGETRFSTFGGQVTRSNSPSNGWSGLWQGFKEVAQALVANGAESAANLRDRGFNFTSYDDCVLALGFLKGELIGGIATPATAGGSIASKILQEGLDQYIKTDEDMCKFIYRPRDWRKMERQYGEGELEPEFAALEDAGLDYFVINIPRAVVSQMVAYQSVLEDIGQIGSLEQLDAQIEVALNATSDFEGTRAVFADSLVATAMHAFEQTGFSVASIGDRQWSLTREEGGIEYTAFASADLLADPGAGGGMHLYGLRAANAQGATAELDADDLAAFGLTLDDLQPGGMPLSVETYVEGLHLNAMGAGGWSPTVPARTELPVGFTRTVELPNGFTVASRYDGTGRLVEVTETLAKNASSSQVQTFGFDADGTRTLRTTAQLMIGSDGSYVGMETDVRTREIYRLSGDADGNTTRIIDVSATSDLRIADTATVFSDVNNLITAIRGGDPVPALAGGLRLLNNLSIASGVQNANLAAASNVAAGVLTFYNLYNAFNSDDTFGKVNASLTALNYANETFKIAGANSGALSNFLNGTPLSSGGSVGVLPVLGLVASIRAKDPIGAAMSIGTMIQGSAFLTTNPVGWVLLAASIMRAFLDDGPPDAWGISKVTFGEGVNNLDPLVHAQGENFGPDRARQQLQGVVDVITQIIANNNQSTGDSSKWLGLIPQRMPGLTFRAAEFADKGYAVSDIDPLTGAQRIPFLRFDDNGSPFGFLPGQLTAEERAMLALPGTQAPALVAYMLNSALQRGAIAPMWEVRTAKMQEQAGDPNAGLTEEERAAKLGLAAPVDAEYAASHQSDPQAKNRRVGQFMVIGLDLGGDGRISNRTIDQIETAGQAITFDWDGQGYQKQTGWVAADDAFLVLDHNFNQSADQAKELFSNPLISDAGKGLRILSAYDANQDGVIDASDPVFQQLRVWQDLNQDGDNTRVIQVNAVSSLAQDETNGVKELRTLQEAGITSIDYSNGRYQLTDGSYRLIATQTLEAEEEGTRYTSMGAGIQIKASNGAPQILVTQVQSEEAVYEGLQIAASGETIGTPGAELYEDGMPTSYDPNSQGGPVEIVISAAQLLQNDTWAEAAGAGAGLVITGVRAGEHTTVSLRADGNISLRLAPNYHGSAEFFYTVAVPGYEAVIAPREARVGLNITPVNDAPTVVNQPSPVRQIYGYQPKNWAYSIEHGTGENAWSEYFSGSLTGLPIYAPYVEHIPAQPIYEFRWVYEGENAYWREVQVGTAPARDVEHLTPIATDHPNTGRVLAFDVDGGSFRFEVVTQATYGTVNVGADGSWTYVGRRPGFYRVHDVTGDGQPDWLSSQGGVVSGYYEGDPNINSNAYLGAEVDSFADYFTVRVYDESDPSGQTFRDVQLQATHYGPPPLPIITDSGGKPIAIDLDGDGFHFQDVDDSNVFFDVNGDGWRRRIAWTEPGDGLLAFDKNADGKIDRFDEISFVPYAPGQQTDMGALAAAFDTNQDGKFDAADAQWASFGVWNDANSNGITDAGEFRSLHEMGITEINLSTDGQFRVIDGQTVHGIGAATLANGGSLALADVTLRHTNEIQTVTYNPDGTKSTGVVVQPAFGAGQDFEGTAEADLVFGTNGSDRFRMSDGDDVVVDDGGDDVVDGGAGDDQIFTGSGNDVVYGGAGNDSIYTGAGNDLVFGDSDETAGDDLIMLEDGNDIAFGGYGNDFIAGGAGNDVISGDGGDDKLFGEAGWDVLFGGDGDDELYGMEGNDLLDGGDGNDLLAGGVGDDQMEGGAGDDTYEVDSLGDSVIEAAGAGHDSVHASITYTLGEHVEDLRLFGDAAIQGTGNAADNLLVGNDQANTLVGLAGNDTLDGGLGADTLIGGAGDDVYIVDSVRDIVIEAAGEGNDTVRSRVTRTLEANVENLTLVGIAAINGTGNELDNVLVGNVAANVLDGGAGADLMRGGKGDDTYLVDNAGDQVVELANEGVDTVVASVSYALSANVENLTLTGSAITAKGNDLGNVLVGNAQDNLLDGVGGADMMLGGAGDDTYVVDHSGDLVVENAGEGHDTVVASVDYALTAHVEGLVLTGDAVSGTGNGLANVLQGNDRDNNLDGGAGADTMAGGAGNDVYHVDDADDVVVEAAGEGTDAVISSVSYTLAEHVENLALTGSGDLAATGNALANLLTGNAGNNVLDGGAGADTMAGGAGDDLYRVDDAGDVVVEQAGDGTDTVLASVSYTLSANVENLTLTGTAIAGSGNELGNILIGNAMDNLLNGGAGADTMDAGAGDDTYIVDHADDKVVETADEGVDTVRASVSYNLSGHVENLVLTGLDAIDGTGNALDNVLHGNAAANRLDGGAGADWMAGGGADDTYVVDNVGDVVVERADEGVDSVAASVSYGLSEHVENLRLTGEADIDGYGNELENVIEGNAGANLLDGGAGGDRMAGGAGDDTYVVDDVRDLVVEWFEQGTDRVLASIDYVLPQHVENLVLTGSARAGTGNELANAIVGNAQDNWLDGGAGADWMAGGAGDDTYVVDNVDDVVVEQAGEGTDHVIASVSYTLVDAVEHLTLAGGSDIDGTGNALDNRLVGNSGRNRLDGGAGADHMAGGAGDDTYIVDNVGDAVVEAEDEGYDVVHSSVSYGLADHVEALVLTGDATHGTGNALDNDLTGNALDNMLDGGAGADATAGGAGNDTYIVDHGGDRVIEQAGEGHDTVFASVSHALAANVEDLWLTGDADIAGTGNELANAIHGNSGDNLLAGGAGNDTYHYQVGGGLDTIEDSSGDDTVRFGPGLTLDNVALRIVQRDGQNVAQIRVLDASGTEMPDQGIDFLMHTDAQNRLTSPLERFVFEDGSTYLWSDLLIQSTTLVGGKGDDLLIAGRNDDWMFGDRGNDVLYAGSGHDTFFGGDGDDILYGQGGNDRLYGGNGDDELHGGAGDDHLHGENGDDYLLDLQGNNHLVGGNHSDVAQAGAGADRLDLGNHNDLADAGAGNDIVLAGTGDDWVAAGRGDDLIDTGSGRNLVAFNRGDGADTVVGGGQDVLSLGGGIRYDDMKLAKSGFDLLVQMGEGDSITLKDWYRTGRRPVDVLQVVTERCDHEAGSQDRLRDNKVEVFDFQRLVQRFDQARAKDQRHADGWAVMNSLLDAHLGGSDAHAFGGDLSFQYATAGSLTGIGLDAARDVLDRGGASWQALRPRSELEQGAGVKLA